MLIEDDIADHQLGDRPSEAPQGGADGSTVSVRLLWPVARLLGSAPEVGHWLSSSGLGALDLARADTRLPRRQVLRLLTEVCSAMDRPLLGLEAGLELDAADLGAIEQAARSAPTVLEALQLAARYLRILTDSAETAISFEQEVAVVRVWSSEGAPATPAANDFAVGAIVAFLRRNVPRTGGPLEVRFAHPRPEHAARCAALIGAPVRFGAPHNAVVLRREVLLLAMPRPSFRLCAAFELQARQTLEKMRASDGATKLVRESIVSRLDGGTVCMRVTAKQLGMSVATLRRRLADEGTTFSGVVDDLRRKLAAEYLLERGASVGEVASQLGFSGVAAFGRAFKRWTGATPSDYRSRPPAASAVDSEIPPPLPGTIAAAALHTALLHA